MLIILEVFSIYLIIEHFVFLMQHVHWIFSMWFSSFVFVFFLVIFVIAMSLFPFSFSEKLVFLLRVRGSVQIILQISDYRSKKISVHPISVHVMAAQSSNQLFYGVSASVAPDGSLVIDESAADRVQTQPVPMLLEDFLSDESSSEEGQAKSPTKIEKWKNKMIRCSH